MGLSLLVATADGTEDERIDELEDGIDKGSDAKDGGADIGGHQATEHGDGCSSGDGQRSKPHPGAYRLHLTGSEDIHDHVDGTQHEHGSQQIHGPLDILVAAREREQKTQKQTAQASDGEHRMVGIDLLYGRGLSAVVGTELSLLATAVDPPHQRNDAGNDKHRAEGHGEHLQHIFVVLEQQHADEHCCDGTDNGDSKQFHSHTFL